MLDGMSTFSINGTVIDLPDFLDTRIEDGTLIAYPPDTDFANLRFTVITLTKDGHEVASAGENLIRERAAKSAAELHEGQDRVWYHETQPSSEGTPGSLMHYWYVGMDERILMVSCFIDAAQGSHPLAQRVLATVEPTIHSSGRDANAT
jgi:hypothetical protein